jgi:SAM-dependent methyltransferase
MESNYRKHIYSNCATEGQKGVAAPHPHALMPRIPFLKQIVRRHFPPDLNASILDLGCGCGTLIGVARQMGYRRVRGVDSSPEQVAAAKALGIDSVQNADALEALGKEDDSSIDCVVSFDFVEHFAKNELIPIADSIYRILGHEGRWIIHTPNAESPFGMRVRYGDLTHELAFTRLSLGQLLVSSGFSQVNCYEDEPAPHGVRSTGRLLLWKCIRSILRLYLVVETGDAGREAIFSQNFVAVARKE